MVWLVSHGTLRRHRAVDVRVRGLVRAGLPSVGTLRRYLPSGVVVDFGTLRRYLGPCDWLETGTRGIVGFARDASTIPCAGVRVSCGLFGLADGRGIRSGRVVPGGWAARHHLVRRYQGPCDW